MSSDTDDGIDPALFQEPDGYYESEKPATFSQHTLLSGQLLSLRLVGHDPLWGHLLWNASRVSANYLEARAEKLVKDKTILELGAGAGLPSLVCAIKGAGRVVVTDYPDQDLIQNLKYNIQNLARPAGLNNIVVEGYLWGNAASNLTSHLPSFHSDAAGGADASGGGFDLLILADLLFNHSEHRKLVVSVQKTLKRTAEAKALVFFSPHRPWLFAKDMAFFDMAKDMGFVVDKVLEEKMEEAMVCDGPVRRSVHDYGDEEVRKVVFGYELRWKM